MRLCVIRYVLQHEAMKRFGQSEIVECSLPQLYNNNNRRGKRKSIHQNSRTQLFFSRSFVTV